MEKRLKENLLAEEIKRIAERDLDLGEKLAESIQDCEAKVMAFLNLYFVSKDQEFVKKALEIARNDEDFLRIVEVSGLDIVELINNAYRRDLAYASLFERTGKFEYLVKISDRKIASASMKRISEKLSFPQSLEMAKEIPDPYYRCLALMQISEKEGVDLGKEIMESLDGIENPWLQKWLRRRLAEKSNR
ncbi:MAG: hypothetical protein V6S10_04080 [Candidatus Methanoglobus sp.]|jgi:hypothetical protein